MHYDGGPSDMRHNVPSSRSSSLHPQTLSTNICGEAILALESHLVYLRCHQPTRVPRLLHIRGDQRLIARLIELSRTSGRHRNGEGLNQGACAYLGAVRPRHASASADFVEDTLIIQPLSSWNLRLVFEGHSLPHQDRVEEGRCAACRYPPEQQRPQSAEALCLSTAAFPTT